MLTRALPADPASRAATLSVLLNSVSMFVKLGAGVLSGSLAVLSDGIDSLEDLIASGIALASVRYGARPPDASHPYGHGRAETVAATVQAVLIGAGGVFILYSSVRRIVDPPESIETGLAIVVMLVMAVANFALVQYTSRVARMTRSPAIASEARHLMTNVVQAVAITLGLVIVFVTAEVRLDGVIAFVLGCYLLWIAAAIIRTSIGEVLDQSLQPEELAQLEAAIREVTGRDGSFHELRTRRTGQVRHVDFHLALPGDMSIRDAHAIIDRLESRIVRMWPGSVVTVHADPLEEGEQALRYNPNA
jgi:cation diffusion facilitator family transporter